MDNLIYSQTNASLLMVESKVEGGGVCVNIIGSRGDIAITAMIMEM